jgi:hypothetical protein
MGDRVLMVLLVRCVACGDRARSEACVLNLAFSVCGRFRGSSLFLVNTRQAHITRQVFYIFYFAYIAHLWAKLALWVKKGFGLKRTELLTFDISRLTQ